MFRNIILLILALVISTSSLSGLADAQVVVPDPTLPGEINYINPNVPETNLPQYPGEYYETLAPATLDLAERARLSINALTGMLNPDCDYELYFAVDHMNDPPAMRHTHSDLNTQGKYFEVTPLVRMMCGSKQNLDVEHGQARVFLKMQGPDGLIHLPVLGRPWVVPEDVEPNSGMPGRSAGIKQISLLGYGNVRALGAFSIYAQKDPEGPWRDAARREAEGLKETIVSDGDVAYFFDSWTMPGKKIVKPESPPKGIYGGMMAWIARYLVRYDRAVGDAEATQLAEKIMRYNLRDLAYLGKQGKFMIDGPGVGGGNYHLKSAHFHTHSMNMMAALDVVERTGNKEFLDLVLKSYEWAQSDEARSNPILGYFPVVTTDEPGGHFTSETCEVSDMIIVAIQLSKLGIDKWDDVDRWLRNQLAENQLTQTDWRTDGRDKLPWWEFSKNGMTPGEYTTDRVLERTIGGFAGWPSANDWISQDDWGSGIKPSTTIMNCCSAAGARGLYYVWRNMIEVDRNADGSTADAPTLRVNLLLNRASKWADIESHIPYTGRVEVKAKQDLNLEVRIPEWVEPQDVECSVDGKGRTLTFRDRYALIGKLQEGQVAVLTFPIFERTDKFHLQGKDYTIVRRGNTVVSIDPPGKYHPLYQRGHYRSGQTLYRKVTRFVSDEDFEWW